MRPSREPEQQARHNATASNVGFTVSRRPGALEDPAQIGFDLYVPNVGLELSRRRANVAL